jgi:hypothetical protein
LAAIVGCIFVMLWLRRRELVDPRLVQAKLGRDRATSSCGWECSLQASLRGQLAQRFDGAGEVPTSTHRLCDRMRAVQRRTRRGRVARGEVATPEGVGILAR